MSEGVQEGVPQQFQMFLRRTEDSDDGNGIGLGNMETPPTTLGIENFGCSRK